MIALYESRVFQVWLLLVAVTLLGWFLVEETAHARIGATAVLLIAAFKVSMIVTHFMEIRRQHRPWHSLLTAWIGTATVVILGGYWITATLV